MQLCNKEEICFLKSWKGIFKYFRISFIPQIVKANIFKRFTLSTTKFKPVCFKPIT
jgi:hypothetical protein